MIFLKRGELDEANLVQFLVAGHFFSGQTLAKQIRSLKPGEFLVFDNGTIKREQYYVYQIIAGNDFDKHETVEKLNQQLEEAMMNTVPWPGELGPYNDDHRRLHLIFGLMAENGMLQRAHLDLCEGGTGGE